MIPIASNWKRKLAVGAGLLGLLWSHSPLTLATPAATVSLVVDEAPAPPVQHGLGKLKLALRHRGMVVEEAV
jgi:hypothetical protein